MAKLIYFIPASLDGFISDDGDYEWSAPSDEAFAFITELIRPMGAYLYGRKNYETMTVWQTPEVLPNPTPGMLEFARIWQAAEKIVYSRSLETISTPNTRLVREFDPQAIRDLKAQSSRELSVAGPTLAAEAIRAGLVDEIHLLVAPAILGGGRRVLPANARTRLELLDQRRFDNGMVYLRYRTNA
jgi:dihydrofolate reductase